METKCNFKKLSVFLFVATAIHTGRTLDATALIVATVLLGVTCGKDMYKIWYKFITGWYDARK